MHDSSPGPRRRISLFINSVRASQRGSRMGSDDSLSHYSLHSLNKAHKAHKAHKANDSSTHKLLRKLTGKTAKGSSIIKRDGSVILVKNGKIVSMREDVRRRNTSGDLDDVFLPSSSPLADKYKNGTRPPLIRQPNLNILYESNSEKVVLGRTKYNENGSALMCRSISEEDLKSSRHSIEKVNSSAPNIEILISEATNAEETQTVTDSMCSQCQRLSTFKPMESRCSHGLYPSPLTIRRSRSDTIRHSATDPSEETVHLLSKSEQNVYKLPLLASPSSRSFERLKTPAQTNGTASDSELNANVPLYTRRWLKHNVNAKT